MIQGNASFCHKLSAPMGYKSKNAMCHRAGRGFCLLSEVFRKTVIICEVGSVLNTFTS